VIQIGHKVKARKEYFYFLTWHWPVADSVKTEEAKEAYGAFPISYKF